jgi:uncharacterized phage-associated protein
MRFVLWPGKWLIFARNKNKSGIIHYENECGQEEISMKQYESIILAKYIAARLNEQREDVNITKIQKLTYIAYGTYLSVTGSRLIDEHPQAWPYGPVFPTTRNKLLKIDLNSIKLSDLDLQEIAGDTMVASLITLVYKSFGKWPAFALSEWSHKEGSPWEKTVSSPGFKWGNRIDDEYIKSYFGKIIINPNEKGIESEG